MTDGRHGLAEDASLALHRAVAERLRADPSLGERARRRVEGWLRDGAVARRLRETSPLAGVLDARTRWAIRRRAHGGATTP